MLLGSLAAAPVMGGCTVAWQSLFQPTLMGYCAAPHGEGWVITPTLQVDVQEKA